MSDASTLLFYPILDVGLDSLGMEVLRESDAVEMTKRSATLKRSINGAYAVKDYEITDTSFIMSKYRVDDDAKLLKYCIKRGPGKGTIMVGG